MRRGITVLSDLLIMVVMLAVISVLWVYAAHYIKPYHLTEASAASSARELESAVRRSLENPGTCLTTSLMVPRGVRLYLFNLTYQGNMGTGLAIVVVDSGADINLTAVRNYLVRQGIKPENVKTAYYGGEPFGVAVLVNGTVLLGYRSVYTFVSSDGIALQGPQDLLDNKTYTFYYNYKDSRAAVCSRWVPGAGLVGVRLTG